MPGWQGQGAGRIGTNAGNYLGHAPIRLCTAEGCDRPMWRANLCRGHKARQDRGQDVDVPLRPYRKS